MPEREVASQVGHDEVDYDYTSDVHRLDTLDVLDDVPLVPLDGLVSYQDERLEVRHRTCQGVRVHSQDVPLVVDARQSRVDDLEQSVRLDEVVLDVAHTLVLSAVVHSMSASDPHLEGNFALPKH